ncbi:MAG: ATP-dependent protease ATPase subunit HslU, partial [Planctomycetota bacterium]
MKELTPRKVVEELNKYIIGQEAAKKAVSIAVRNRWRRQQLPPEIRDEVAPKNIIMIGPTGVGKTEIAKRLSNLVNAPFLKIEASKYTEIGYVGRDVESMIRDLVEVSVNQTRMQEREKVEKEAKKQVEERLLDALIPRPVSELPAEQQSETDNTYERSREKLRERLHKGELEDREVDIVIELKSSPTMQIFSNAGIEHMGFEMQNLFDKLMPGKEESRKVKVSEARKILSSQEAEKLLDRDKITKIALQKVMDSGIIFIDELDKIAGKFDKSSGPDVSREGVQRDLLPIVEGSTVPTRHGLVKTDHVLFIAAGAFNVAKPSDLIPELQGRFPIRVELSSLGKDEFKRIMTEPKNALTKQYTALLETEGVKLRFKRDAIEDMARMAEEVNTKSQNIGARRLYTIFEKLLEDLLFEAPE